MPPNNGLQMQPNYYGNNEQTGLHPPMWSLSPNADAAMNSFWDDMMWETFPDNQDWIQGLDQFDWNLGNGQAANDDTMGQEWQQWLPPEDQG